MNINLLTCDSNLEPGFTPKNIRAGKMFLAQSLLSIVLWVMTACSVIGRTTLQGTEHLACSPEIHFMDHSVICQKERGGNWVACQASGRVENNGSARVSNVIVTVEFGHVLNDMRSSTINLVGDLDPGEQADFKSDFSYYERLTEYDIKLGCDNSISAQPSPVPSPRIFFTQLLPKRDVFTLAIDPTVPTTIYAGTEWEGVFKSVDGGLTWVPSNTGMVNVKIGALAIDPLETNILYAGTYGTNGNNGAAYKSVDSGESWVEITNGMGGAYIFSLAMDPIATSTIYAGTSDGVFRSTDGGGVWTRLDTGDPDPYITRVVVDPLTPTNLYAVSSGTMQGILKSTNAGHDWSLIRINPDFTYPVPSLVIDPSSPTILYSATWMGVFKSTNAGATWSAINTGLGDFASVSALIIDPIRPATLYAAIQDNDVFTTTNGGESWSALESNLVGVLIYTLAWDPANPTILYAGTANGVYVLGKKSGI